MHLSNLRTVGGSVMVSIPKALLDVLSLEPNTKVGMFIENGRLIVEPAPRRRKYTLDELVAECDLSADYTDEDRAWLDMRPVGNEIIE